MERLTEVIPSDGYYNDIYAGSFRNICNLGNNKCTSLVHNKLGQKEDDDEELGIDSHLLFKALSKKFASLYKDQEGNWKVKPLLYDEVFTPKEFVETVLTKEELEQ